ncbi:MAG TPA: thioredoxin family protein [Candidatus Marinimicrobia bacterium]|nr:thioredoxin family protein [Candidatus Neomarinimicrobiota bacterium]HRS52134.1 thioredoxin family protein [Candidatus Neomarinimicrobiota bacterium]HRU92489.1 thioredoxin family protein [Candidatus Neomarinimicrobiota bacterium]
MKDKKRNKSPKKEDMEIIDVSTFDKLIQSDKPVVIEFYDEKISTSYIVDSILSRIANYFQNRVKILRLHINQHRAIANKYHIFSSPATLIFLNGKLIEIILGTFSQNQIIEILNSLL